MEYGMQGIGVFWCLVEMLYEQGGFIRTEYERIAYELRTDTNVLEWIINKSGLFVVKEDTFYSETVLQRLEKRNNKSIKARESVTKRWNDYRENTNVIRTNNEGNTIKERKGKEIKVKEIKENKKELAGTGVPPPFNSEEFTEVWNKFLQCPKQRKKPPSAIELISKKLKNYDEKFSIELLENAISGNYQGVIFADTNEKYERYKRKTNGAIRGLTATYDRGATFD